MKIEEMSWCEFQNCVRKAVYQEKESNFVVCTRCRLVFYLNREFECIKSNNDANIERLRVIIKESKDHAKANQIDALLPKYILHIEKLGETVNQFNSNLDENKEKIQEIMLEVECIHQKYLYSFSKLFVENKKLENDSLDRYQHKVDKQNPNQSKISKLVNGIIKLISGDKVSNSCKEIKKEIIEDEDCKKSVTTKGNQDDQCQNKELDQNKVHNEILVKNNKAKSVLKYIINLSITAKLCCLLILLMLFFIKNQCDEINRQTRLKNTIKFCSQFDNEVKETCIEDLAVSTFSVNLSTKHGIDQINDLNNLEIRVIKELKISNVENIDNMLLQFICSSKSPKNFVFNENSNRRVSISYYSNCLKTFLAEANELVNIKYSILNVDDLESIIKGSSNSIQTRFYYSDFIINRQPDFSGPCYLITLIDFYNPYDCDVGIQEYDKLRMIIKAISESSLKISLKRFEYSSCSMNENEVKELFKDFDMRDIIVKTYSS